MITILNQTPRFLRIHLSRGKVLRLGPRKEGQISTHDVDSETVKQLVADGAVKIMGEGAAGGGCVPGQPRGADRRAGLPSPPVGRPARRPIAGARGGVRVAPGPAGCNPVRPGAAREQAGVTAERWPWCGATPGGMRRRSKAAEPSAAHRQV